MIDGQLVVFESDFILFKRNGVQAVSWSNWKHRKKLMRVIPLDRGVIKWDRVIQTLGKKYAIKDWFKHLGNWFRWNKSPEDHNTFTCTKLVAYILDLPEWWKASPKTLEDKLL